MANKCIPGFSHPSRNLMNKSLAHLAEFFNLHNDEPLTRFELYHVLQNLCSCSPHVTVVPQVLSFSPLPHTISHNEVQVAKDVSSTAKSILQILDEEKHTPDFLFDTSMIRIVDREFNSMQLPAFQFE